ncbi:MAG: sulfatase-like hydrolase/transferase, partial [Kiritimatiellae bacterium]|nr:sulfatase-like hydrolase/transferase [Kiritimatiellia bacterium]
GEMLGVHRLFQKMCMYEDAIRVPLLVKPPNGLAGVRNQLTQHLDIPATICDYAGCEWPQPVQGQSMRRLIEEPCVTWIKEVFVEFNGNSGRGFQQRALVTPTHKFIHNHGYAPECYDLVTDPNEVNNICQLTPVAPEVKRLRKRLQLWMTETGDYLPPPSE